MSDGFVALLVIGGPIVLGAMLLWAIYVSEQRRHDRAAQARTDAGTKKAYKGEEQERELKEEKAAATVAMVDAAEQRKTGTES